MTCSLNLQYVYFVMMAKNGINFQTQSLVSCVCDEYIFNTNVTLGELIVKVSLRYCTSYSLND